MSKILYLTYDGLTDPLGQSQILPYLFVLSKKGIQFTIISFEKKENKQGKSSIANQLKKHDITWYPLSYTKKPPIVSTIRDIYRLRKTSIKLHNSSPFDLVHCRSYITSLVGLYFKRKRAIPFVFDMRGFWADERFDGKIWSSNNPLYSFVYRYFKKKEKEFLTESDFIISLTKAGKKIIETQITKNSSAPIKVIPCCVDNSLFNPDNSWKFNKKVRKDLNIQEEQFVLGYVGSIGTWYMLPEMILFFTALQRRIDNAIFLFVTKEDPKKIENTFKKYGARLDSLRIIKSSRLKMPLYISIFTWSIFFIKPVFSKQASSPTKQGEIMSMNKPIICNAGIGDTDEIFEKYTCGVLIEEFKKDDYLKGIETILTFSEWSDRFKARVGSQEYFSLDVGAHSYLEVYEHCFSL